MHTFPRIALVALSAVSCRGELLPVRVVAIAAGSDTVDVEIDVALTRLLALPGVHGMKGENAL